MRTQSKVQHQQMTFDWSNAAGTSAHEMPREGGPVDSRLNPQPGDDDIDTGQIRKDPMNTAIGERASKGLLVRVLKWDFRSSVPSAVRDAHCPEWTVSTQTPPAELKQTHAIIARKGLELLTLADEATHALHMGVDERTGEIATDPETRKALRHQRQTELERHMTAFEELIEDYADAFETTATDAFRAALRVWHMGGIVITPTPPIGIALPQAIAQGHFGYEDDGTVVQPSEEEIAEITRELTELVRDESDGSRRRLLLAKYAEDFGHEAADLLDEWCRHIDPAEEDSVENLQYDPGHPWHYYHLGDSAEPIPVEQIPEGPAYELPKVPKEPQKRTALLKQMLHDQEQQLTKDAGRYNELIDNGPLALSEYDRTIAYAGNDDLAWASSIALKFNHIRYGKSRVSALRKALAM